MSIQKIKAGIEVVRLSEEETRQGWTRVAAEVLTEIADGTPQAELFETLTGNTSAELRLWLLKLVRLAENGPSQ